MSFIAISDLTKNKNLDCKHMTALTGGTDPLKALAAANHLNAQAEADRLNGMADEMKKRKTTRYKKAAFAFSSRRYFSFF